MIYNQRERDGGCSIKISDSNILDIVRTDCVATGAKLSKTAVQVNTWGVQVVRYPKSFLGNGSR